MLLAALLLPSVLLAGVESLAGGYAALLIVPALFILLPILRLQKIGLRSSALGFAKEGNIKSQLGMGITFGVLAVLSNALFTAVSTRIAAWWLGAEAAQEMVHLEQARVLSYFAPGTPSLTIAYLALVLVVVTPIAEELFFRGYVYASLRHRLGVGPAIITSAVVFGGFHFYLIQFLPVFAAGVLFAWLYERTHSIIAPMVAHAFVNGVVVVMLLMQTS